MSLNIWPKIHEKIYDFTWHATITPPPNVMGNYLVEILSTHQSNGTNTWWKYFL